MNLSTIETQTIAKLQSKMCLCKHMIQQKSENIISQNQTRLLFEFFLLRESKVVSKKHADVSKYAAGLAMQRRSNNKLGLGRQETQRYQ